MLRNEENKLLKILLVSICLLMSSISSFSQKKRDFRGAWIQCVNGQFQGLSTDAFQRNLTRQLDILQKEGANAIIFQVRPECDALYESPYEPWSRFLTGQQGVAPAPYFDPLKWMVEECHNRGMELHAWINPYRAKTKGTGFLADNHIAKKHPERVFTYDNQLILNPASKENREYICGIVGDILRRYDVDGLHIDDYFYPYPVAGQIIPDESDYQQYVHAEKKQVLNKEDWRRVNVNKFIKQLQDTIKHVKPWVKFGVSPFGIYRNLSSDAKRGSKTNGLQNYDDLYADVLLWIENGWIDYVVPQIYWQIGHSAADYETLIQWWNDYAKGRPLFIGEDIERTVKYADLKRPGQNQMQAKFELHDKLPNVEGTVLWYSKLAVDNLGNYGSQLQNNYWKYPSLQPLMPFIDKKSPKKVRKLKLMNISGDNVIFWSAPKGRGWKDVAHKYVVYRFKKSEEQNLEDASKIVRITSDCFYKLPDNEKGYTYVITALDRMNNESEGKILKF